VVVVSATMTAAAPMTRAAMTGKSNFLGMSCLFRYVSTWRRSVLPKNKTGGKHEDYVKKVGWRIRIGKVTGY
jgi:hypothetical protein